MTSRTALSGDFLRTVGWGNAIRRFLAGDASARSYDRLSLGGQTAVLMDAPSGKGDDPATFMRIASHLRGIGLSAPQVLAQDITRGFLLLEDLGDDLYARLMPTNPAAEAPLYATATDVLVHLQHHPAPTGLPNLTATEWAEAASLALKFYAFAATSTPRKTADFVTVMAETLHRHADGPRVLILRDYHAENLLWLPQREGLARVGLLDFQLAQMGQPGYDLVSLLQDARRDVPAALESAMTVRFMDATGSSERTFCPAYAALGAQRALRILGVFARLCVVDGKPQYLPLIPRVWGQLQRNLAHPALASLAAICRDVLPAPTPARLERIAAQCAKPPMR